MSLSISNTQHDGKTTKTIERDKDNIKDQAQIWTDTDQTKVSTQHQPCDHATRREEKTTQTIGRDNIKNKHKYAQTRTKQDKSVCTASAIQMLCIHTRGVHN